MSLVIGMHKIQWRRQYFDIRHRMHHPNSSCIRKPRFGENDAELSPSPELARLGEAMVLDLHMIAHLKYLK